MRIIASVCSAIAVLAVASASAATPSASTGASSPAATGSPITILHAGVVSHLVDDGLTPAAAGLLNLPINSVSGNSVALSNSIKARKLKGDLFMSADASVNQTLIGFRNGNWVKSYYVFARNEVVLAYSPKSRFAAQFERARAGKIPFYKVLEEPGIKLGRDDPNLDPLGYYDLFVGHLAGRYYKVPGLAHRILGTEDNPNQVLNTNPTLLTTGKLDAEFMYLSGAKFANVPYVTFPDAINLGNPADAHEYAHARYTTNLGHTFRGAPIQVSIAALRDGDSRAATNVIELLFSNLGAFLRRFHFLHSRILVGGNARAVPRELRRFIKGAYHAS